MDGVTMSINFDVRQLEAIEAALDLTRPIVAITGEAGSGKTTLIAEIARRAHKNGKSASVGIAAPTGKAARRVTQATGYPAVTIHRLLGYALPYETTIRDGKTSHRVVVSEPKHDRENPLPYDLVIVDEYAMVGQELHRNLFDALKRPSVIRVFGDVNQLRPVEERVILKKQPSPFADLLERFNGIRLGTIHRQMGDSGIVYNAHRILNKRTPERRPDFRIEVTTDILRALRRLLSEPDACDYSKPDAQILTPSNHTNAGTYKLNVLLQAHYMRGKQWVHEPERHENSEGEKRSIRLFVGDKVIFTKNDYVLGVFNGETGYVADFHPGTQEITVELDDRVVHIPTYVEAATEKRVTRYNPQKNLDLAYAITTHKAQGSEYEHVIYMMHKSMMFVQSRPNFYTGVTRARKGVILLTDAFSLTAALRKSGD